MASNQEKTAILFIHGILAVSYTHLDVYKRQVSTDFPITVKDMWILLRRERIFTVHCHRADTVICLSLIHI